MTCQALEEAIVEVGRGRDVGRGTAAAVEAHVEHCDACAAKLARERVVSSGLRALATATAGELPSPLLERELRRAFADRKAVSRASWWRPAAAAAAIFAAIALWQATRPEPAAPVEAALEAPAPAVAPNATNESSTPQVDGAKSLDRVVSNRERRSTRTARPAQPDAGFVTLPAAIGLPDFESGVIVRMELPVAALPSYGIEVVPDSKVPVEADLLIGQDGQARAIRLVNRVTTRSGAEQ